FCATLGNKKNKETFIQQNDSKDNIYPDLDNKNRLKSFNYQQTFKAVNYLMKQMLEIFSLTSEKAKFVNELENVKLAYENAKKTLDSTDIGPLYLSLIRHIKSKIINKYIYKIEKKNKFTFFMKLKLAYIHKIGSFDYLSSMSVKEILDSLKTLFFELKIEELNKKINFISNRLSLLNSKQIEEELQIKSQDILNYALIKRYNKSEPRKIFTLEDLSDSSKVDDFLQEYPVILSTTDSIRNSLNLGDKLYDYLIIDESSQVNLVSGFLALTTAKNLIIVGDNKQLSHIIEQNLSDIVLQINQNYMYLLNKYDVINYNLLTSIMRVFQIADNSKNRVLLKEHYRCNPKIIEFCNKKFYNEELIILSEDNNEPNVLRAFITSKGNHAIDNKDVKHINFREVDVIKNEILPALYKKVAKDQIGIIAPYKNQKELLQSEIDGIKINTIHSFQGQEMDAIIITTVDNEKKDFSDADELINVAISRAKKYLFVVTSYGIYHGKHGNIKDLISHIQYNLCEIDESKIKSIFDILYQENDNLLNEYIRKQDKNIIKQQIKKQNQIYKTNIDENKIEKSEII
ncbi:DEAD/DEAH box helicase, partial [uncultured Clostridium sp.]|uniref:DEAD/DEAH box helicase n=1 Tax=uncultured Clostridium sp. TaxID=59620 RepID=UPI00261BB9B0